LTTIGNGRDAMPAFGRVYKPEDLHDVAAFILEELVE
jgi:mono/diheme cytochrome c family protein